MAVGGWGGEWSNLHNHNCRIYELLVEVARPAQMDNTTRRIGTHFVSMCYMRLFTLGKFVNVCFGAVDEFWLHTYYRELKNSFTTSPFPQRTKKNSNGVTNV